ncbi:MAG: (Fe-S)-binding protein [Coriobacteriales bacterium]|jgi:Fe-S oxidoreductase|nr:(Fe-S)-binding protein [Coriobacteriales bacterium]
MATDPTLGEGEKVDVGLKEQRPEQSAIKAALRAAEALWQRALRDCALCGRCAARCPIYDQEGAGQIGQSFAAAAGLRMLEGFCENGEGHAPAGQAAPAGARWNQLVPEALAQGVREFLAKEGELYHYLRRCCLCDHCTAWCPSGLATTATVKAWRRVMAAAGVLDARESQSVLVDQPWHIFSVYRAVWGISYPEWPDLATVAPETVDTVFFPGCSLVSYAPELTRAVGRWLDEAGLHWALCLDCCGSPLVSAGLAERSLALRQRILAECLAAGVRRVVTVCSGCAEELGAVFGGAVEIVSLPQLMCELGGNLPGGSQAEREILNQVQDDAGGVRDIIYAIHDSCHDRAQTSGAPLRALLEAGGLGQLRELEHSCRNTACCGAGGAVAAYDPTLCRERAETILSAAAERGAGTLITTCPTCAYTMAQYALEAPAESVFKRVQCKHYLEVFCRQRVDWDKVFAQLGGMWTGQYAAWVAEQLG